MAAMGGTAAVAVAGMAAAVENRTGTRAMKAIKIGPISTGTRAAPTRIEPFERDKLPWPIVRPGLVADGL
tara:strand:+ start:914 stop:1123 length:210 start_codon:yes stop_codon:yes gene_type:complete